MMARESCQIALYTHFWLVWDGCVELYRLIRLERDVRIFSLVRGERPGDDWKISYS